MLQRPELTQRFSRLAALGLQRVLDILTSAAAVAVSMILTVSRDPGDDRFLATAHAARATYLVLADNDLLVLADHEGIQIINCFEFANLLETSGNGTE